MTAIYPVAFQWDGDNMLCINPRLADRQYVVGEIYRLVPQEDRSDASHNHYFATINEAWKNLPEDIADRWPTSEHLRKWALIKSGYRDERTTVAASKAEAQRLVAFIRPIDDYAVVIAKDAVVTVYTAKSQSMRAMGKADFQKSKADVLDVLSGLIGVGTDDLRREAGKAA